MFFFLHWQRRCKRNGPDGKGISEEAKGEGVPIVFSTLRSVAGS